MKKLNKKLNSRSLNMCINLCMCACTFSMKAVDDSRDNKYLDNQK